MGRKRRVWVPDFFYHVSNRGNRKDPLFHETDDFKTFLYIFTKVYEKAPFELASYCLMTNHYHLQIRSKEQPLSKVMSFINKRYADYYNTKYDTTGHVFEKRFFDKPIISPAGMLEVSGYIHFNPVKANIVGLPEHYKWSSYLYYKDHSITPPPYMNTEILRDILAPAYHSNLTYSKFAVPPRN